MARYIDLDKCGQYRTNHGGYPDTFAFPPWAEFEDVAPVIHAHWILYDDSNDIWDCSNCKMHIFINVLYGNKANYCPNCGAIMDEETE